MKPLAILLLGLAMSTDAFAAALGKGAGMSRPRLTEALRIGLIFGVVEGLTPIIGWLLGSTLSDLIESLDHWIAFGLLSVLGLHMIWKAFHDDASEDAEPAEAKRHGLFAIAMTGLATSIDAMAVGIGLAFVDVNVLAVAAVIGLSTFVMVTVGILAGHAMSAIVGRRAEALGGLVLIAVGSTILYEHLHAAA